MSAKTVIAPVVIAALMLSSCSFPETIEVDVTLPALSAETLPPDPGVVVFGTNGILDDLEAVIGVGIARDDIVAVEQQLGQAVRAAFAPSADAPVVENDVPESMRSPGSIALASTASGVAPRETNYSREGEAFMAGTLTGGMLVPSIYQSEGVSRLPVGGSSNTADRWGNGSAESSGGVTVTRTSADTVAIEVTQVITSDASGVATTITNSVSMEGTVCPLDDGEFDFTVTLKNTAAAQSDQEGAGTVRQDLRVRVTGRLGTDGRPEVLNLDGTQETAHTAPSGRTISIETRHRQQNASVATIFEFASATGEVVRSSGDATPAERRRLASLGAGRLSLFGSGSVIGTALNMWGDGGCVKLRAPAPERVAAQASTPITVSATSTVTGAALSLPVTLRLDGQQSIQPDSLTTESSFTHVAGDADTRSTVLIQTASRRGRATLVVAISTAAQAYFAEGGGGDIRVSGVICDLLRTFTLEGQGVTLTFRPTTAAEGVREYADDGRFGGGLVELSGEGPYTVTVDEAGVATGIVGSGTGRSSSAAGTFSFPLSDRFTLTPIEAAPECSR